MAPVMPLPVRFSPTAISPEVYGLLGLSVDRAVYELLFDGLPGTPGVVTALGISERRLASAKELFAACRLPVDTNRRSRRVMMGVATAFGVSRAVARGVGVEAIMGYTGRGQLWVQGCVRVAESFYDDSLVLASFATDLANYPEARPSYELFADGLPYEVAGLFIGLSRAHVRKRNVFLAARGFGSSAVKRGGDTLRIWNALRTALLVSRPEFRTGRAHLVRDGVRSELWLSAMRKLGAWVRNSCIVHRQVVWVAPKDGLAVPESLVPHRVDYQYEDDPVAVAANRGGRKPHMPTYVPGGGHWD